ncbi:hypothetical protein [uncultured Erythrobacter sp.]|uniref:AbiTii domain-containing protein n=1 Tax=uncultured Erythrobacter sp. TaxID=263913 RepID=UPI0026064FD8|nr:hypothetical protein [uncultured Erythrobacter sp.]
MAILSEIQEELLKQDGSLSTALLKLRYLASRLGSADLEEWVVHEIEGYPKDQEVPEYRLAELAISGTFSNGFQMMSDVSVPPHIIKREAGEDWVRVPIREAIGVIDSMVSGHSITELNDYGVSVSAIIPLLSGKVYEGMECLTLNSKFAGSPFLKINQTIRSKTLDLTLELEKKLPAANEITLGSSRSELSSNERQVAQQVTHQHFYGSVGSVTQGGDHRVQTVNVIAGDLTSLRNWLLDSGIDPELTKQVAEALKTGNPQPEQLEGDGAFAWIKEKLGEGAMAALGVGKEVAKEVITSGIKAYYGLS